MKITILTYGSTGDVVPYVALALGLKERGYSVILAAPTNFENYVKNFELNYSPIFGNTQEILESEQGQKWMATGNLKPFMKEMSVISYQNRCEIQRDTMLACEDADLIIGGTLMTFAACIISEKLKIPFILAFVNPVTVMTGEFPHFIVTPKVLPFAFLNRMSYRLFYIAYEQSASKEVNEWRCQLGLPVLKGSFFSKIRKMKTPVLHGYSPNLLPKPADWSKTVTVTGSWKLNSKYKNSIQPDEGLVNWLAEGEPPIYFGFGSMPVLQPEEMQNMVHNICSELGVRAIINAGWSRIKNTHSESSVCTINHTDLEWLFPKCSTIVHHGGVGTTHLSLEAGVPAIICSIFADNPFWGERLNKLNVGRHIKFKELSKQKIIRAILQLQQKETRDKVIEIGKKIKSENGLQVALDFIEQNLSIAPIYYN